MKKNKNFIFYNIVKKSVEFNNRIRNNNKSKTPNHCSKNFSKEYSYDLEKTEKEMCEKFYLKRREGLKGLYNVIKKPKTSKDIDKLKNKIINDFNLVNNKISFFQFQSEKKKFYKNIQKLKKKENKSKEKSAFQFSRLYKRNLFDKKITNNYNKNNNSANNIYKLERINLDKEVIRSRDKLDDIIIKRIKERSKLFSNSLMSLEKNEYSQTIKQPKFNNLFNENNLSRIIRLKKIGYNKFDIDKDYLCKYNCKYLKKFGRELNNSTYKIIEGTLPDGCKRSFSQSTIFKFKSFLGNQYDI